MPDSWWGLSSSGHLWLELCAHWDGHTSVLRTSCPPQPLLLLCLQLLECFRLLLHLRLLLHALLHALLCALLHALLLLHALSSPACLSALSLVLECPQSQFSHPSHRVCFPMGVSSGSACGGVLAHLCCSLSSGDDCHLATI